MIERFPPTPALHVVEGAGKIRGYDTRGHAGRWKGDGESIREDDALSAVIRLESMMTSEFNGVTLPWIADHCRWGVLETDLQFAGDCSARRYHFS
jgi:hypothetical protein